MASRPQDTPVDLSECAREPIHIPAAIQPHGALLVARADGARITHASANLAQILGVAAEDALGRPIAQALGDVAAAELLGGQAPHGLKHGRLVSIAARGGGSLHLRSFHAGPRFCVDIEPMPIEAWQRPPSTLAQAVLESFQSANGLGELCELAVHGLRAITGYDRVMAYRFGADGHGEVIAEARAAHVDSYLGQRYPASDIPPQARQLYLRQRVGVIVDAAYAPVPLLAVPGEADTTPVDLTHSALRSVSPLHREFMRNMRTAASMTIGIGHRHAPSGHELWGMIVCHHETPRLAGPHQRAVADMLGQVISLLLESQDAAEINAKRASRIATLRAIAEGLASPDSLPEALGKLESELLALVGAAGALVRFRGRLLKLGVTPEPEQAELALRLLHPGAGGEALAVDDLGLRFPPLAASATTASGALLLPLGDGPVDAVLWFRPELAQTVTWGGNPAKAATSDPATGRISPRASFEAWREVVRGRSAPWGPADLALAAELRRVIDAELARRARLALDLFNQVFESAPTALLLVDQDGAIEMLNRQAETLFGYARQELHGRPLEILVPERLRARHASLRSRYAVAPTLRSMGRGMQILGLRKNGSEFPAEITLSPTDPTQLAGETMFQASVVDVTERHAIERARRRAQQQFESIARHVPAMIGYWTRDERCEFANEGYRAWFGMAPEQIVGMHLRDLLGEELYAAHETSVKEVLAGREQRFERMIPRPDGSEGYSDARYLPDFDSGGEVRGFYVLVTDVTPLRLAQVSLEDLNAKLQFTNQELDQFVYTAAHDLRSPLRGIASLTQFVIEDDATLTAQTRERLAMIAGRVARMQNLLNDVLVYARAGKGGYEGGIDKSAASLVDEISATLTVPDGFTIHKDPSLTEALVMSSPLSQVLQNLIGNAIKHHDMQGGTGTVTVAAERRGNRWRFTVTDDGPGIPAEYRDSVFNMFTTLKRRDELEASGMGLALVRKLVMIHGGECGIESAPGRGARIWFDWPTAPGDDKRRRPASE
jgi:PAS domain S-box-containing protein